MLIKRLSILVIACACLMIQVPTSAQQLNLQSISCPKDSVLVKVDQEQAWVRLADLNSTDTSLVQPYGTLVLMAEHDTLFVHPEDSVVVVLLEGTKDTIRWHLLFGDLFERNFKKYLAILREYPTYGHTPLPDFAGISPAHDTTAESARLRERFNLDSIAGPGGQLSRLRNLLHWVHTVIRWNGNKDNPEYETLVDRIARCIDSNQTMNCGGLASTYAGVCRAVGYRAAQITCMSADKLDTDCHGVVVAYCDSLQAWLYLDPTFEAWFTDEVGRPLDVNEIRDRLIRGGTLIVNNEANTNGSWKSHSSYIAYIAKNMFRFLVDAGECEVILTPSGFDADRVGRKVVEEFVRRKVLYTDNAEQFWAEPIQAEEN